jgi:hypothetical protein
LPRNRVRRQAELFKRNRTQDGFRPFVTEYDKRELPTSVELDPCTPDGEFPSSSIRENKVGPLMRLYAKSGE